MKIGRTLHYKENSIFNLFKINYMNIRNTVSSNTRNEIDKKICIYLNGNIAGSIRQVSKKITNY